MGHIDVMILPVYIKSYRSFKVPSFFNTIWWNRIDHSKPPPHWLIKILSYSKKTVIEERFYMQIHLNLDCNYFFLKSNQTEEMISTQTYDLNQQWVKLEKLAERLVLYGQVIFLTMAQGQYLGRSESKDLD